MVAGSVVRLGDSPGRIGAGSVSYWQLFTGAVLFMLWLGFAIAVWRERP